MKHISLHLLLSVALIGQVNAMTNKMSPRTIKTLKPTPKIEAPATNGMNANDMNNDTDNVDNNDDDDYTVEAEFMADAQTNDGNGFATQLETKELINGTDDIMQNEKEAEGDYGATQGSEGELTLDSDDSNAMPEVAPTTEMPDVLTDADIPDIQNKNQDKTIGTTVAAETQNSILSAKNTRK